MPSVETLVTRLHQNAASDHLIHQPHIIPQLCIPPSVHSSNLLYSSFYDSIYTPLCRMQALTSSHTSSHICCVTTALMYTSVGKLHSKDAPCGSTVGRALRRLASQDAPHGSAAGKMDKTLHAGAPSAGRSEDATRGSAVGQFRRTDSEDAPCESVPTCRQH